MKTVKRRFKNLKLQQHYEICRKLGSDITSEFYHEGVPRRGAGHRVAYWCGRSNMPYRAARNTFAYASYVAGKDDRKEDAKKDNLMAPWILNSAGGLYFYPPKGWKPILEKKENENVI